MSPGIDSQPGVPVRQPYLTYRPGKLHSLAELIPGLHKRFQIRTLGFRDQREDKGRGEKGGVSLPSQLECTPQLG